MKFIVEIPPDTKNPSVKFSPWQCLASSIYVIAFWILLFLLIL